MSERTVARSTDRFSRKREAILDAATDILNRQGIKGLTLGGSASAVGLSTTSVTYYFRRKDDLAAACIMRGVASLQADADQALGEPDPAARVERLWSLFLERLLRARLGEAPPLPHLSDLRALNPQNRSDVYDAYMRLFRKVRGLFEAPETAGLSRGRRTARTHLLLEQMSWTQSWLQDYPAEDYPRLGQAWLDLMIEGFAVGAATWAPVPIPMAELASPEPQELDYKAFMRAATRLINSRGYRGASVDLISAALNVTKGSFYHHHEAKDDLVVACLQRSFVVMHRMQRMAKALADDPWTRLATAVAALVEYQLCEFGPLLRTSCLRALPDGIRDEQLGHAAEINAEFAAWIAEGAAAGRLRAVDPAVGAQMLMGGINAAAELGAWAPGVTPRTAPPVFARPLLTGLFRP